jgi:transposase
VAHLYWLSDEAYAVLEPHLPLGRPRVDDRRVISGILYVLKTGCRWRDVPRSMVRRRHLQPLQQMVRTQTVAAAVREGRLLATESVPGQALVWSLVEK